MSTGENEQALRKIIDMTRLMAIVVLFLHFYYYCYGLFFHFRWTAEFTDRIITNIRNTGLYDDFHNSKFIALGLLITSLLGAKGKKDEKIGYSTAFTYLLSGLLTYFISYFIFKAKWENTIVFVSYIGLTTLGFILVLTGGTLLTRIIKDSLQDDIFNTDSETFPQEERWITNEYSFNFPAKYRIRNKIRNSVLNFIAPFRGIIIQGGPGAGKTAFLIRHFISQALNRPEPFEPYTMLVYDFKFPDLSLIAYNHWLKNKHKFKHESGCYFINFDDLTRSHRGNPLDPLGMEDITDASESARTILYGLNRDWQKKMGDFFVESAINFVTAVIWWLRKYQGGQFCTLPHVIEFIQLEYDQLFSLLNLEEECRSLVGAFIQAFKNGAVEQLEGQIASAKIALARLSSPQLYYVLSGDDFKLDINNPEHPKVLCLGNNPQKIQTYGAVLSLYVNRLLKIINKKNKLKCMLVFDEYPTLTADVTTCISTGRSNLICVLLGLQSIQQLIKEYGKEQAEVIINIVGNIASGQVTGEGARKLSEQIGKIMQDRQSLSINRTDTSISKNKQLEFAVPASKIANFSSGEFAGVLSDTPQQKLPLKAFHCEIQNDFDAIQAEEKAYKPVPVIRQINNEMVQKNYQQIKEEVQEIANSEIQRMMNDPELEQLVVSK